MPQCDSGMLSFAITMHMRIKPNFRPPDIGHRVHASFDENGHLRVVGMRQNIIVQEPVPESDLSLILECEIVSADSKRVVLQCVNMVPLSNLQGHS